MVPPLLDNPIVLQQLRRKLLRWYYRHQRDLPWRRTSDPYRVWVSEIMLQQTRVAAVLEHYERFLRKFPTLASLASAKESAVLASWSGLGYYRRARNLHAAAKKMAAEFAGQIPRGITQLRELPGIGRYTAAAVASIAFQEPVAVVDGNVERVVKRLFADGAASETKVWDAAEKLLSRRRPGDFNQAMMELGAEICLPREPRCRLCPLFAWCRARGTLPSLPAKEVRRRMELRCDLHSDCDRVYLVRRRSSTNLMPGMWELPVHPFAGNKSRPAALFKHSILSTDYRVLVFRCNGNAQGGRWIKQSQLAELPLTGLARKILRHFQLI